MSSVYMDPHSSRLVRLLLQARGLTHTDVALKVGRSTMWLSTVFTRAQPVVADLRPKLCEAIGVPQEALFPIDGKPAQPELVADLLHKEAQRIATETAQ